MTPSDKQFKIRTITCFTAALPDSDEGWEKEIHHAALFLRRAQQLYEDKGYEVQTLRICTRALSAATDSDDAAALASHLEAHCLEQGIAFLSLGGTSDARLLDGACLAALTRFSSCSFRWQQGMGLREAQRLAAAIHGLAEQTSGAGNFRFGVAFNCQPGIPYFPVAAAGPNAVGFAIGTENSGLLHAAFQQAAAGAHGTDGSILDAAQASLQAAMAAALGPVQALAEELAAATGQPYLGIDASIAPALEPPTIPQAYELLGLGRFGCCGTLAVSERITAALKALPLRLCGYSGLMLPVCEDAGLAAAASEGRVTLGSLLHYSAVCGCGLDTVPVPGATSQQAGPERAALLDATAALLLDVAAMAHRLDKPLSVRLLPAPGAAAGQLTAFDSPYLLNCCVLPIR